MPPRIKRLLLLLWAILLLPVLSVTAQGTEQVVLRRVNADDFPRMTVWFDALSADGHFLEALQPNSLLAVEDEAARTVDNLQLLQPGVRFIIAINLGPQLALRDAEGVSRLDKILARLAEWAAGQPQDSKDTVLLVAPSGPVARPDAPQNWRKTLAAYQPDARDATPDVRALSLALDQAMQSPDDPLTQTVILWITPHLEGQALAELSNQQQRALEAETPIYIWWVDSEAYRQHSGTQALQNFAELTQGAFYLPEDQDSPEPWLQARRYVWQASYQSGIQSAGAHAIKMAVTLPDGRQVVSNARSVDLDVQPPNPIFVTPPTQIVRQMPPDKAYDTQLLTPQSQTLDILIEFPDGHPRGLVRTSLYVDDQIVDEHYEPPFDHFEWDLSAYDKSAQHILRVEVVDELGLSQVTAPTPVTVTVLQPPKGILGILAHYRTQILVIALTITGLLILAMVLSSWLQTRPVQKSAAAPQKTRPVKRRKVKSPRRGAAAGAFLERIDTEGGAISLRLIPLDEADITIGTDPVKATFVLDDSSAAPLHARIKAQDGRFVLFDADSVAGTWCNYAPVPTDGRVLRHGDMIHFGRVAYRFFTQRDKPLPRPKIINDD